MMDESVSLHRVPHTLYRRFFVGWVMLLVVIPVVFLFGIADGLFSPPFAYITVAVSIPVIIAVLVLWVRNRRHSVRIEDPAPAWWRVTARTFWDVLAVFGAIQIVSMLV